MMYLLGCPAILAHLGDHLLDLGAGVEVLLLLGRVLVLCEYFISTVQSVILYSGGRYHSQGEPVIQIQTSILRARPVNEVRQ